MVNYIYFPPLHFDCQIIEKLYSLNNLSDHLTAYNLIFKNSEISSGFPLGGSDVLA